LDLIHIKNQVYLLEKDKIFNELDYIISEEEIMKAINYLKNNKAAGFDIIINEMLKCGQSWI
jgi:hypothetical protein